LEALNFDFDADGKNLVTKIKTISDRCANLDPDIDKEVFTALLKEYRSKADTVFLPETYQTIARKFGGDERIFVDSLYAQTGILTQEGLNRFFEKDPTYKLYDDPAVQTAIDLIVKYYEINQMSSEYSKAIDRGERELTAVIRRTYAERNFYPDANATMRLSFGTVMGYSPFDGVRYNYSTTVKGILEKTKAHEYDPDFAIEPELAALLASGDYEHYAPPGGEMKVCFLSNNDITGGNSGSAMFNGKGELMGLAFDGNWEAMSGDILFDPDVQRCIGVDVRYLLFIIEKYAKAGHLIQELKVTLF
jgi:hypothetical protein